MLKIKVSVKLLWTDDTYSERLYYKIKYKFPFERFHTRLKECVATTWLKDKDDYIKDLYYYTRKENIMEVSKELIKNDIIERGDNIGYNNKHRQILKDIRNINKEKIEFEFEVEQE